MTRQPILPDLPVGQYWEAILEDEYAWDNTLLRKNVPYILIKQDVTYTRFLGLFKFQKTEIVEKREIHSAMAKGGSWPKVDDWRKIRPQDIEATAKYVVDYLEEVRKDEEIAAALLIKHPSKTNYNTFKKRK